MNILLGAGADVNAQAGGWTALMWAADKGQVEYVKILARPWNLAGIRERIKVVLAL